MARRAIRDSYVEVRQQANGRWAVISRPRRRKPLRIALFDTSEEADIEARRWYEKMQRFWMNRTLGDAPQLFLTGELER